MFLFRGCGSNVTRSPDTLITSLHPIITPELQLRSDMSKYHIATLAATNVRCLIEPDLQRNLQAALYEQGHGALEAPPDGRRQSLVHVCGISKCLQHEPH